ncbi:MAG: peptidoglycan-binding domain-containing protein [Gallionella sp.]
MKKFVIAMIAVLAISGLSAVSTTALAGSVPISQLNMDAVPSIDQDGVRRVQTLLKERGFDPGPIDGVEGVRTTGAVRGFQERFGIKASGSIDNQTLFALGAVDLAG